MKIVPVHNEPGLVRDEESSVILNTNWYGWTQKNLL